MAAPVRQVAGTALPLRGHDLDTDRMIPARFVRTVPWDRLGGHVFADDRSQAARVGTVHPFDDPRYRAAVVVLVERNFGCGSSREHAVSALAGWGDGIRALVGRSFANIFQANALANGIPCATSSGEAIDYLFAVVEDNPDIRLVVDVERGSVDVADRGWSSPITFAPGCKERLLDGTWDPLERLLAASDAIARVAEALPYHRWMPQLIPAHDRKESSTRHD